MSARKQNLADLYEGQFTVACRLRGYEFADAALAIANIRHLFDESQREAMRRYAPEDVEDATNSVWDLLLDAADASVSGTALQACLVTARPAGRFDLSERVGACMRRPASPELADLLEIFLLCLLLRYTPPGSLDEERAFHLATTLSESIYRIRGRAQSPPQSIFNRQPPRLTRGVPAFSRSIPAEIKELLDQANQRLRHAAGGTIRDRPLFILAGPARAGKTTALYKNSPSAELLTGREGETAAIRPDRPFHLWLLPDGAIVAELCLCQPGAENDAWRPLLLALAKRRSLFRRTEYSTLQSIILCLDVSRPRDHLFELASRELLDGVRKTFGAGASTQVVFTHTDSLPFFANYFSGANDAEMRRLLSSTGIDPFDGIGHALPRGHLGHPLPGRDLAQERLLSAPGIELFDSICHALSDGRLDSLVRGSDPAQRHLIYQFPRELRRLRVSVNSFLTETFEFPIEDRNQRLEALSFLGSKPFTFRDGTPTGLTSQMSRYELKNTELKPNALQEAITTPVKPPGPLPPSNPMAAAPGRKPTIWDQNVQCTVYRPRVLSAGRWHDMLAYMHAAERPPDAPEDAPDPRLEVQRLAKQALGSLVEKYQGLTQESSQPIPRGGAITLVPEVGGLEFNPPSREFLWMEAVHEERFRLRAAQNSDGMTARGWLRVFLGPVIVAEVALSFPICAPEMATAPDWDTTTTAAYRRIFPSYSHKDAAIVEEVERFAEALGDKYLRDVVALRSGEAWDERLCELISKAHVFQLFWSTSSMRSEFVEREWKYALELRRANFVRPVYWEQPLPQDQQAGLPPRELRDLHFHFLRHGPSRECMPPPMTRADTKTEQTRAGTTIVLRRGLRQWRFTILGLICLLFVLVGTIVVRVAARFWQVPEPPAVYLFPPRSPQLSDQPSRAAVEEELRKIQAQHRALSILNASEPSTERAFLGCTVKVKAAISAGDLRLASDKLKSCKAIMTAQ